MAEIVRLELLLNRRVRALNGRVIGRLEEVLAETAEDKCYVTEYLVGAYGFLERFAAWPLSRSILQLLRLRQRDGGYRVRWNQLDLNDPARPRLRCNVQELSPIDESA